MVNDRRSDALGDLRVLPDEILCSILTVLEPRDVGRLSCVSRFRFSINLNLLIIRFLVFTVYLIPSSVGSFLAESYS